MASNSKRTQFRSNIRKSGGFFTMREVMICYERLYKEVVDVPSLKIFKVKLDGTLSNLLLLKMFLLISGELG